MTIHTKNSRSPSIKTPLPKAQASRANPDKRTQIIHTAGAMFVEHGFGAVSMDALAEAVPVSKPTLYNHFGDKKTLFLAVMEDRCATAYEAFTATLEEEGGPRAVLSSFARTFLDFVLTDRVIGLYRLMVAEAKSFPELGATFYSSGPRPIQTRLAAYLQQAHEAGDLHVPEPLRAASLFSAMIGGEHWKRALLGILSRKDEPEIQAALVYAVDMFLKAHGIEDAERR